MNLKDLVEIYNQEHRDLTKNRLQEWHISWKENFQYFWRAAMINTIITSKTYWQSNASFLNPDSWSSVRIKVERSTHLRASLWEQDDSRKWQDHHEIAPRRTSWGEDQTEAINRSFSTTFTRKYPSDRRAKRDHQWTLRKALQQGRKAERMRKEYENKILKLDSMINSNS